MGSNRGLAPPKMPAVQTWLLQVNAASRCYSGENGSRDGHRSGGQQEMASKPKTRGPRWFETQNHTKNGLAFRCIYATSPDESYTKYYIQAGRAARSPQMAVPDTRGAIALLRDPAVLCCLNPPTRHAQQHHYSAPLHPQASFLPSSFVARNTPTPRFPTCPCASLASLSWNLLRSSMRRNPHGPN